MANRRLDGGAPVCFSCGQPGHHIRDCPNKGASSGGRGAAGGGRGPTGMMVAAPQMSEASVPLGHTPADAQKRIKQLLIMLTPDYQSLTQLASALLEDLRAHQLHEFLASTLLHCVRCMPHKSMIFVGLVAAMRIQMHRDGHDAAGFRATSSSGAAIPHGPDQLMLHFLSLLGDALVQACANGAWDELRLLARFIAGLGLANIIGADAAWEMVERLHALLTEGATASAAAAAAPLPNSQREYLLYTLITMMPFMADAHDDPRFSAMRTKLQTLVSARAQLRRGRLSGRELLSAATRKAATDKMQDDDSSSSSSGLSDFSFDLIDCWWSSLSALQSKDAFLQDASEVSIQRSSYQLFRIELDNLCKPLPFAPATLITIPSGAAPRLRSVFRLFPRSPRASASNMPLNDLVIGDSISDILTIFESLHKEGSKQLLQLPLPLSDEARQNGQFLLIETVLENLLTLPSPNVRPIYYGTIFIDLFKAQPNLMPPLLGTAVNALFHRIGRLDLELTERLLDWFTFHLSNFAYVWPWVAWRYVLDQADNEPQRVFVAKALALCVRLSYWERIQQVIPEEFLVLMPHQPHPAFRFSAKNVQNANGDLNIQQYYQLSVDLCKIVHGKSQPNAVIAWLDSQVAPLLGSEARLRLFTPCVLECGNQSYSHVIALLDRYKSVFQVLCSTTTAKKKQAAGADAAAAATAVDEPATLLSPFDCQRLILHSLSEYWQHSVQHLIVVTEQLHAHGIISMQSVVAWVFFSGRHPERAAHLWKDVLFALLRKSLAKLQRDVDAVLHKPRAMAMATERRADDERAIESLLIERRELLVSCVANFQRLLSEVQKRDVHKEKDRARMEQDLSAIKQRFAQFARMFRAELAASLAYVQEAVPKSSPLSDLVAQIPMLL